MSNATDKPDCTFFQTGDKVKDDFSFYGMEGIITSIRKGKIRADFRGVGQYGHAFYLPDGRTIEGGLVELEKAGDADLLGLEEND